MVGFGTILVAGFGVKKYFRDIKQERLDSEKARTDLMQTIIQINEEVLLRHGLIEAGDRGNG